MTRNLQKHNTQNGYTMIELLLATVVGSIVLAGAFGAYNIIGKQFNKSAAISDVRDFAVPTLRFITRDLRMAGFKAVDTDIESDYGRIDNPITITDSGTVCCDSVSIIYDKSVTERLRVTYYIDERTNGGITRNAIYMDVDQYQSSGTWTATTSAAIVADYVEDFQLEGDKLNDEGEATLVHLNITFRSKNKTNNSRIFDKKDYLTGNVDLSITDNYLREEFESTIYLRNLVD